MTEQSRGMGDNKPPSDTEILLEKLAERTKIFVDRAKEFKTAFAKIPKVIEDDATAEKITTFVQMVGGLSRKIEDDRTKAKAPSLLEGKTIDTFYKAHITALTKMVADLEPVQRAWLKSKADAERQRLLDEAESQRQTAAALVAVAVSVESVDVGAADVALEDALEAEFSAGKMTKAAQAKTGLAAVRTESGSTSYLRSSKVGSIADLRLLDLEALRFLIPLPALQTAINAYIRNGGTELKGALIVDEEKAVTK